MKRMGRTKPKNLGRWRTFHLNRPKLQWKSKKKRVFKKWGYAQRRLIQGPVNNLMHGEGTGHEKKQNAGFTGTYNGNREKFGGVHRRKWGVEIKRRVRGGGGGLERWSGGGGRGAGGGQREMEDPQRRGGGGGGGEGGWRGEKKQFYEDRTNRGRLMVTKWNRGFKW